MSHQIHEGDIEVARTLLFARRPETQVVAALVYRGMEQSAAAEAVELLRASVLTIGTLRWTGFYPFGNGRGQERLGH